MMERALDRELAKYPDFDAVDRVAFRTAFLAGWRARTATGEVLITQERLDHLEARAGVCWGSR